MPKNLITKDPELVAQETLVALITNESVTQAAEALKISRTTLYERIHKYNLLDQLKEIKLKGHLELLTASGKAATNLTNKIDHEDPNISLKASTEVLDRVGLTKPNENRTDGNTFNFVQVVQKDKDEFGI